MRFPGGLLATLVATLALALPGAAEAKPRLAGTFELSGTPGQIARGPDGNIWVLISGSGDGNTIAKIRPNGNVTEYSPDDLVNPIGLGRGPDGNLWCTRNGGVVRVDPEDPDSAEAFDIATIGSPQRIIGGPQGKLWTASNDDLVSFLPNDPLDFDEETIDGMGARGIATSGGKLWIADFAGQRIIRANPNGTVAKAYDVGGGPQWVTKGPKDGAVYSNPGDVPQTIGRIDPPRNPRKTKTPKHDPFGIAKAADGNWWFANFAKDSLTILSRDGKDRRFRKLPDDSGPRQITAGPNNTLWVSLEGSNEVARIKGVKR
jgi:streptogramin lyase